MNGDVITTVFDMVRRGTQQGQVKWQETSEEDAFRVSLGSGMIFVRRLDPAGFGEGFALPAAPDGSVYTATVVDPTGKEVEECTDPEIVRPLFLEARRSARRAGRIYESMIQQLESLGIKADPARSNDRNPAGV